MRAALVLLVVVVCAIATADRRGPSTNKTNKTENKTDNKTTNSTNKTVLTGNKSSTNSTKSNSTKSNSTKPTPAPAGVVTTGTITQSITLEIAKAQYTGDLKELCEMTVAFSYGVITEESEKAKKDPPKGFSISSKVAQRRSNSTAIEFVATVPNALLVGANAAAKAMTPVSFAANAVKMQATLASSPTFPKVAGVGTPACKGSSCAASFSGTSHVAVSVATVVVAVAAALKH